jgi:hypothetical protein
MTQVLFLVVDQLKLGYLISIADWFCFVEDFFAKALLVTRIVMQSRQLDWIFRKVGMKP